MKSVRGPTNACNTTIHRLAIFCLVLLILLFTAETVIAQTPTPAGSGTFKVLYHFRGGSDGANPYAGVILDKQGNLYGTTELGGAHGRGTVFQLTPSGSDWAETVLYSFTGGTDGAYPSAGVIIDDAGNLYGATATGGDENCSCGTVFQLTPSASGWTLTTLYTFHGSDGAYPGGGLTGRSGELSGTTTGGGSGFGTAFELRPSGSTWTLGHVYRFNGSNGEEPWANLTPDGYGTTLRGGSSGSGKVFDLRYGHQIHVVHSFSPTDKAGSHPMGGLIRDSAGNLYGTTYAGSAHNLGAVFQMTPSLYLYDTWNMHVLHSFSGVDGALSAAGVVIDKAGNLYGTTTWGGADPGYAGTVFQLSPGKPWTETVLHSFSGGSDGSKPYAGVVLDDAGNLYGTTYSGGTFGAGVVFQFTPGTTTTVVPDHNPSVVGEPVMFTATVSVNAPRSGIPSGAVKFLDGATEIGTVVLDGTGHGALTTSALPEGIHSITATYTGGSEFPPSTSSVLKQQVGRPALTLSATSLVFASQVINTTSTQKFVTLTNTGSAPLTIGSIKANGNFAVSSTTCGSTLAIGAKCKVNVAFTPTVLGKLIGTIVVTDNAPNSPQTVALFGTGVLPVALTPASATFAARAVGTTSLPKVFTLINNQTVVLNNLAIAITGDFGVASTTCSTSLAAKGRCTISVVFAPVATGIRTGELRASDSANNSPQTSTLTGTGK
jgi:uncharacterized repeat protein (TIGR03803 family)